MADDAEMTLIPSNTEPATGSAAAEPPKQDTTNIFGRFKKKLLFAEETVVFFKHLSILGLVGGVIGTAVGSYFQYVSWREEQNIARYKEDFAAATAVFSDVASTLSTAVNLQQILYFTFRDAVDAGVDKNDDAFQTKTARDTYKSYVDARNALRERIDALARKMEIYIHWPSDRNRDPTVQRSADPLNSHSLGEYDFDCAKYLPNFPLKLSKLIQFPNQTRRHPCKSIRVAQNITSSPSNTALKRFTGKYWRRDNGRQKVRSRPR